MVVVMNKENTCKMCRVIFYHKYGQVLCQSCLMKMGNEQYKSNIESRLWEYFEKVGCKVKSVNINIETNEANITFIPPATLEFINIKNI